MSREDKIKELEEELSTTKYNKRTQHHVGLVKAKIAKLRDKKKREGKKRGLCTEENRRCHSCPGGLSVSRQVNSSQ